MIAIMIPIKPYWFAKILNGEKKIEVRKNKALAKAIQKLIDKQGYAPILGYCSLGSHYLAKPKESEKYLLFTKGAIKLIKEPPLNGKVPALLICREVEETRPFFHWCIEKETCLTRDEVLDYLDSKDKSVSNPKRQEGKVYAIHISQLEIFDKPKELSEFRVFPKLKSIETDEDFYLFTYGKPLTKAPQSFMFIEV